MKKNHNSHQACEKFIQPSTAPLRLNKAIAQSGYCSRRKADALILAGQVSINGKPCANPATCVTPDDSIAIAGKILQSAQALAYLMLNKPAGIVSTVSDPQGRRTVIDLLPQEFRKLRLFPVGRLDYFSEGLLLLTNDGALAHRLMHPRFHLPKRYEVIIRGQVSPEVIHEFKAGMVLVTGERLLPVPTKAIALPDGNTLLELELRQGLNRQIRRMCEQAGLVILKLKRSSEGPLKLGKLAPGAIRALTADELAQLRKCTDCNQELFNRR